MIHPADECPQIAEHSFDLRGQFKLPLSVNVGPMLHRPPRVDAPVDASSVGLESATRLHELIQELTSVRLADGLAWEDAEGDLGGSDLLGHHQRDVLEVRFIHLHRASQHSFHLR